MTNLSLVPRPILQHTEAFFCLFLFSFHPEIHHLPHDAPKNNETNFSKIRNDVKHIFIEFKELYDCFINLMCIVHRLTGLKFCVCFIIFFFIVKNETSIKRSIHPIFRYFIHSFIHSFIHAYIHLPPSGLISCIFYLFSYKKRRRSKQTNKETNNNKKNERTSAFFENVLSGQI